jgi:hypothetical protein
MKIPVLSYMTLQLINISFILSSCLLIVLQCFMPSTTYCWFSVGWVLLSMLDFLYYRKIVRPYLRQRRNKVDEDIARTLKKMNHYYDTEY